MRVLRKFNRLQTKNLSEGIFITCTARNSLFTIEEFEYKFLKLFLPALKKIIPNLVYAWRLEFHKSGFPHYHILVWSEDKERKLKSEFYKRQIRATWRSVINDDSNASRRHSCKIVRLSSRRKMFSYVCKYLAKEDRDEDLTKIGRRWGLSSTFNTNPITEIIIRKKEADHLLSAIKNLLKENGTKEETIDKYVNDEGHTSAWLSLDEILQVLKTAKVNAHNLLLENYNITGELTLSDEVFNEYDSL